MRDRLVSRARRTWPDRPVTRRVQGVSLRLPWSHRLPDYATEFPTYGQNLVELAVALGRHRGRAVAVLDVGANVGDSALQILARVDARVLCVEGDPYWVRWLHRNVDGEPRIQVEPSLVSWDADGSFAPSRARGTTQFRAADGPGVPMLSPGALRQAHPTFSALDLIKVDTDGYDGVLVPVLAQEWGDSRPVVHFEHDPAMATSVGMGDAWAVFDRLTDLGYTDGAVWDNFGSLMGTGSLDRCRELAAALRSPRAERAFDYVDVAVTTSDDAAVLPPHP